VSLYRVRHREGVPGVARRGVLEDGRGRGVVERALRVVGVGRDGHGVGRGDGVQRRREGGLLGQDDR
jgi:hypothetical protein